jgi:hypothetical protein
MYSSRIIRHFNNISSKFKKQSSLVKMYNDPKWYFDYTYIGYSTTPIEFIYDNTTNKLVNRDKYFSNNKPKYYT